MCGALSSHLASCCLDRKAININGSLLYCFLALPNLESISMGFLQPVVFDIKRVYHLKYQFIWIKHLSRGSFMSLLSPSSPLHSISRFTISWGCYLGILMKFMATLNRNCLAQWKVHKPPWFRSREREREIPSVSPAQCEGSSGKWDSDDCIDRQLNRKNCYNSLFMYVWLWLICSRLDSIKWCKIDERN